MNILLKKRFKLKNPTENATHLKATLSYDLGGINYFTYRNEPRGYYISVTPVTYKRDKYGITEGYTAFSGTKCLVKEVARKSKKAEQEVREIFETGWRKLAANVFPDLEYGEEEIL